MKASKRAILMHHFHRNRAEALPELLRHLKAAAESAQRLGSPRWRNVPVDPDVHLTATRYDQVPLHGLRFWMVH
jgi:hypothetical protein